MAVDKLVDSTQLDSDLTSVANAIRTRGGTSSQLAFPNGFVSAVGAIGNQYSAGDEGKVVSSGALVSQTAHADVTPTTSDQTIDTTTNNSIKVKGDADLVAANIKKDVEIFGVTGSYEGGGGDDPSDVVVNKKYFLFVGAANYFDNTLYCDFSNSSTYITRLSIWDKDSVHPVNGFISVTNKPQMDFGPIEIPSGTTQIGITIKGDDGQIYVRSFNYSNGWTAVSDFGWVNYTNNVETALTGVSGGFLGLSIRRNSNNQGYVMGQNFSCFPERVEIKFS